MSDDQHAANQRMWEERAKLHPDSQMYRRSFDKLRAGGDCLLPIEKAQLGDLSGQRLLHLQCHLGPDSLSLVRLGAEVVALDFSPAAVAYARAMSKELELPARFVVGDVLDAAAHPDLESEGQSFDWVFASYGVLCWISDLDAWMRVAAHYLKPGGRLLVVDGHPFAMMLDEDTPIEAAKLKYPYFRSEATRWAESGSYACSDAHTESNECFEWTHRLGQIVNAAIAAGLVIEALDEHAEGYWAQFSGQDLSEDGHYRLPAQSEGKVPLCFSLRACKR